MEDNLTDIVEAGGCSPTSVADSSTCDVPEDKGDVPEDEGEGQATIHSTTQHASGDLMWWQACLDCPLVPSIPANDP